MKADDLTNVPTSVLVERTVTLARSEPVLESDEYWAHVRVLHLRSGRDVFEEAIGLCSSPEAIPRAVGADILAQLGVRRGVAVFPFADESAGPLVALLADTEPAVIASALHALGHLGRGEPSQLAPLSKHASEDVRHALAYALGGRTDAISTATLVALSGDVDADTRNWATFALGALSDEDTPAIRDALAARLTDPDDEVRAEAIAGLAQRRDERAVLPLLQELGLPEVGSLAIDAAGALPQREFIPHLEALHAAHPGDKAIEEALTRCRKVVKPQRRRGRPHHPTDEEERSASEFGCGGGI
jgi:HEAT repeat protein